MRHKEPRFFLSICYNLKRLIFLENENYEESDEDTLEHFFNSPESDSSSSDENLRRVQNGKSLEKSTDDQSLWSSEEELEVRNSGDKNFIILSISKDPKNDENSLESKMIFHEAL